MDYLYPRIDKLISCNTCGSQSLPPYRLCLNGHVGCTPCAKYLALCSCGSRFAVGPHLAFDWVVMAMKLQCKYRQRTSGPGRTELRTGSGSGGPSDELFEAPQRDSAVNDAASAFGDDADDCEHRWYDIQELREHYRDKCKWNAFTCPMDGCGHMGRVDTAAEHYETAHGPCIEMTPADDEKYEVTFKIWLPTNTVWSQIIRKIFNGYFLIDTKQPPRRRGRDNNPQVSVQNVNPADPLRYEYNVSMTSSKKEITITVSVVDVFS